jgi:hypothetical protein
MSRTEQRRGVASVRPGTQVVALADGRQAVQIPFRHRIVVVEEDLGVSGATITGRKGMLRVLDMLERGAVTCVVVRDVGRLTRDEFNTDIGLIARACFQARAKIVTKDKVYDPVSKRWQRRSPSTLILTATLSSSTGAAAAGRPRGSKQCVEGRFIRCPRTCWRSSTAMPRQPHSVAWQFVHQRHTLIRCAL